MEFPRSWTSRFQLFREGGTAWNGAETAEPEMDFGALKKPWGSEHGHRHSLFMLIYFIRNGDVPSFFLCLPEDINDTQWDIWGFPEMGLSQ